MSRAKLIAGCFVAGLVLGLLVWVAELLPRMSDQVSLRPFEAQLPAMPPNLVPRGTTIPGPPPDTPANRNLARLQYGYRCQPCHGADGRSNSPVGESYTPKPADLTSTAVQAQSDPELVRRMVTGVGHEPVLEREVTPEQRWLILRHVRSLALPAPVAQTPPAGPEPGPPQARAEAPGPR